MKGVPSSDVEDFVEPELTNERVEIAVDASQLRSKYIDVAAASHQFPDGATSIIKWHKGTRRTGLKGKKHAHNAQKNDLKLERDIIHTSDGGPMTETTVGNKIIRRSMYHRFHHTSCARRLSLVASLDLTEGTLSCSARDPIKPRA